jgi:acetylornithine/succinyldiaminopimelate/putrescine aminotransferase
LQVCRFALTELPIAVSLHKRKGMNERSLFLKYVAQTSDAPLGLEVDHASGIYLYGIDGRAYTDLISGVSVSNTGHRHPYVSEAVTAQLQKYLHVNVYGEVILSPQVQYARYLCQILGEPFGSVYFVNSGSEAIEGAMKLARRVTGRKNICSFEGAYHGGTFGALSVMGGDFYSAAFSPLLPGVFRIPFNDTEALLQINEETACVIAEPVQAEAGVREPAEDFLQALRKRCDETGALLIFDEVQTGMGRTGWPFAFQKYGVTPDILVLAKAFGGGMPLGAFISSPALMQALTHDPPLGHITTFGGHPVCCAAGLASLEVIMRERLYESVPLLNRIFREETGTHPLVHEIRGSGLLMAVQLKNAGLIPQFIRKALENGLVTDWFLFCDDAFRIAPPLVMTEVQARKTCQQILKTLNEINA